MFLIVLELILNLSRSKDMKTKEVYEVGFRMIFVIKSVKILPGTRNQFVTGLEVLPRFLPAILSSLYAFVVFAC